MNFNNIAIIILHIQSVICIILNIFYQKNIEECNIPTYDFQKLSISTLILTIITPISIKLLIKYHEECISYILFGLIYLPVVILGAIHLSLIFNKELEQSNCGPKVMLFNLVLSSYAICTGLILGIFSVIGILYYGARYGFLVLQYYYEPIRDKNYREFLGRLTIIWSLVTLMLFIFVETETIVEVMASVEWGLVGAGALMIVFSDYRRISYLVYMASIFGILCFGLECKSGLTSIGINSILPVGLVFIYVDGVRERIEDLNRRIRRPEPARLDLEYVEME